MKSSETKHFVFLRNPDEAPAWGGLEKLMLECFERVDYSRCSVTLAISKSWVDLFSGKLKARGIPVNVVELPLKEGRVNLLKRFLRTYNFLKKLKPSSIVFIQGWLFSFDLASVMAGFFAARGEVYMHENLGATQPPLKTSRRYLGFIQGLGLWWYLAKFPVLLRAYFCKKIIVVSRGVKERLVFLWGYPAGKLLVRYHGVDLNNFRPSVEIRRKMRQEMNVPEQEKVIIAASHLTEVKCIHRMIEAVDVLSREFSDLTLLVLGTGPLEKDLKALAQNMSCARKIKFLGHVDNVSDYIKMSDIYVLSSDNEGFGIALIEAMATGLICVATRCPGPNEIIQDGINGFLVGKSTEGVLGGLKKALELSAEGRMEIRDRAVRFVTENFEINERVRDVFSALGLAYSTRGHG